MNETRTLDSSEKLLAILEYLVQEDGAGVTEIARGTGLPKSTVHVHLQTLLTTGHVVKRDTTYHGSLQLFEWGQQVRTGHEVYQKGVEEVNALAEDTGECANLGVLEDDVVRIVHSAQPPKRPSPESESLAESKEFTSGSLADSDFSPNDRLGVKLDVHATAMGKALLAHLPEERVASILDRTDLTAHTEHTSTSREDLFTEFEQIRTQGYAVDEQERDEDICCIAAAVSGENQPIGAVSVTLPAKRLTNEYREKIAKQALKTANVIEVKLTYS